MKLLSQPGLPTPRAGIVYVPHVDAYIIARSTTLPHDPHLRLVAAQRPHRLDPYVTWYENLQDSARTGHPVYYDGHYSRTLSEFVLDWDDRCRRARVEEAR